VFFENEGAFKVKPCKFLRLQDLLPDKGLVDFLARALVY
jgi:hypothetical protein